MFGVSLEPDSNHYPQRLGLVGLSHQRKWQNLLTSHSYGFVIDMQVLGVKGVAELKWWEGTWQTIFFCKTWRENL